MSFIDDETRRKQRENLDKRSASSLEERYAQQNRKELDEKIKEFTPPVITVGQCHVCNCPWRLWIERQILRGLAYRAIAESLPPNPRTGKEIDYRSISNHAKKHMPLDQAVVRAVLEDEADLLNQNYEQGVKGAFSTRGALNTLVRKAYQDAMENITTVEPRDMIQMIKLYNEMSSSSAVVAEEEAKLTINIFLEAIQNVFTEQFEAEEAERIKKAIATEVKRLRQRDEIEMQIEHNLRVIPESV